jgi:hypothetical protein
MIKENRKRAKFFKHDLTNVSFTAEASDIVRKFKILLDGQGRIFSRTRELSGSFTMGELNGKGEMEIKYDKDTYLYKGEFLKGKKHGKGIEKFKGTTYDG